MSRLAYFRRLTLAFFFIFLTPLYAYSSQKVEVESLKISVATSAVTVGTSATALPATALRGRKVISITNNSNNTIYTGDSDVTTSNGDPIYKKQTATKDITDSIVIYGIADSAGNDVRVEELR